MLGVDIEEPIINFWSSYCTRVDSGCKLSYIINQTLRTIARNPHDNLLQKRFPWNGCINTMITETGVMNIHV
jgi:hypothetical protein